MHSKSTSLKFPICYLNAVPNAFKLNQVINPGFANRNFLCTLIASNRHTNLPDRRELSSERGKAIHWFENHAPSEFALFGNGWLVPQKRFGGFGKLRYRSEKILPFLFGKPVFPSHRGPGKKSLRCYHKLSLASALRTPKISQGTLPRNYSTVCWRDVSPSTGVSLKSTIEYPRFFIDFRLFCKNRIPMLLSISFLISDRARILSLSGCWKAIFGIFSLYAV